MKMALRIACLALFLASVFGCASGPEFAEVRSAIPEIEAGKGRIYLYRPQRSFLYVGSVRINGEEIRVPEAGGLLFVDREPGDYEIVVDSITTEKAKIWLGPGEERYVRITVTTEGHFLYTIYPKVEDKSTATQEMLDLNFINLQ
ncbi:MAG: hypothetical protein AMJ66_10585 [Betaproteobacteria bacterium SG8_40]|jgi:hypothetical protein|nr:MAG: hypothetical protein AMJ66_10585 [Betaproteobacteria bacterium SG8_40]